MRFDSDRIAASQITNHNPAGRLALSPAGSSVPQELCGKAAEEKHDITVPTGILRETYFSQNSLLSSS